METTSRTFNMTHDFVHNHLGKWNCKPNNNSSTDDYVFCKRKIDGILYWIRNVGILPEYAFYLACYHVKNTRQQCRCVDCQLIAVNEKLNSLPDFGLIFIQITSPKEWLMAFISPHPIEIFKLWLHSATVSSAHSLVVAAVPVKSIITPWLAYVSAYVNLDWTYTAHWLH